MTNLKDKLMKEIKTGEVTMTPRIRFTLQWVALVVTSFAILAVTVFIVNFIFFSIRLNSSETLIGFGPQGFGAFLAFFPWPLAILDVALVFLLQWLMRHFKFGYRVPLLYLLGGLIVGAGLIGFALDRATPFNDRLHDGRGRLPPPMRMMYEGAHRGPPPGSGMCRCTILAIDGNTLTVEDTRAVVEGKATTTLTVVIPNDARRATTTDLSIGDTVVIFGEEKDGTITAVGIKKKGGPRPFRPE